MTDFEPELETKSQENPPCNLEGVIQAQILPKVNFAIQQSDIPLVQSVFLENTSFEKLENVSLQIESEPEFFPKWQKEILVVEAQSTLSLHEPNLKISPEFMMNMKERLKGKINVSLTNGSIISQTSFDIDVLAYNEWPGADIVPELLAAYILPNSSAVENILIKAVSILKDWGDNTGLNGYHAKSSKKVLTVTAAIYNAIQTLNLTYSVPPASFENYGQKVRFPEKIVGSSLGTCLDLTLLLAACLEGAGLNPIIVITRGHAFIGVWLKDESFPLSWIEEVLPLKKRVELGEICVFETTLLTGDKAEFDIAKSVAEKKLTDGDFIGFLDVKRSRSQDIRPIPITFDDGKVQFEPERNIGSGLQSEESFLPPREVKLIAIQEANGEKTENRFDQWKRKLLDLTLRNRLLNFKETKKSLKILTPSLGKLEDMLADGKEIKVKALPDNILGGRSRKLHLENTGNEIMDEFLDKEFSQHRLYSNQTDAELTKRLTEIYRGARNSLQEGGANTCFLGAGFLNWYESDSSDVKRSSPIILIPLEIKRNSIQEGFKISQRDDEAQINVTLLELLKADFGIDITGLDPLPLDEHGIDLDKILNTFRHHILNIRRWEVTEEAFIGLFHFQKFLMWKDLESRTDKLLENHIVNHLVNGSQESFPSQGKFPESHELDKDFSVKETFCPLSADSSQLVAVHAAASGKSFVLHGPPGTGKSQTITNIIAHTIASGKTVLFVSEKAAALNVVYKRLSNIGLAPFSLELHSNKSKKAEVLKQLSDGLNSRFSYSENEWIEQADQIETLRTELNKLTDLVHAVHPLGISLFQGIGNLSALKETPFIDMKWALHKDLSKDKFHKILDIIENLRLIGEEFEALEHNPWANTHVSEWEPTLNTEVEKFATQLGGKANETYELLNFVLKEFPEISLPQSVSEIKNLANYFDNLFKLKSASGKLIIDNEWENKKERIIKLTNSGLEFKQIKNTMLESFNKEFINQDFLSINQNWTQACNSWWPKSWYLKRGIHNEIRSFLKTDKSIEIEKVEDILALGINLNEKLGDIKNEAPLGKDYLEAFWKDEESDWEKINTELELIASQRKTLKELCRKDVCAFKALNKSILTHLETVRAMKTVGSSTIDACGKLNGNANDLLDMVSHLFEKLNYSGPEIHDDYIKFLETLGTNWKNNITSLRNWTLFNKLVLEAHKIGLSELVSSCNANEFKLAELAKVFEKSLLKNWTSEIIGSASELIEFSGQLHNNKVKKFQDLDEEFLESTVKVLGSKLSEKVPTNGNNAVSNSEMGILNRELRKKRRHKPLRILFQETSNLLPRLKPCFLMSPLSVAQYLSPEQALFDLVIFDEASQMPVWDAIGAIARGKDLIVVGDPKQLPPTSFFSKSEASDWEENEFVEDLDSILEDCLAAGLPSLYLNWHYRSLHESLIAFSNYNYYDNLLHTFPSAYFEGLGLKFKYVEDGIYDKGKSRTNRIEAGKIVKTIVQRLKDPILKMQSIGVVTFNSSQQTLIEDLLDEERRKHPQIEEFFNHNNPESLFVKNLENVQGDERATIIFSICYGKDINGRMSMNFGPLNKVGGERRLNVAVTRARREVIVFSSILPDEINLSRTRAIGVKHLKAYLDYAMRGEKAIKEAISVVHENQYGSPFEEEVANALRAKGYEIHTQIGCSGYRIDLGVVHPSMPGKYALGIECDGASYHSAKCARERDKLRQSVLENLGWKLHRIWSTDWWHNSDAEIERAVQKIEEALLEPQQPKPKAEIINSEIDESAINLANSGVSGVSADISNSSDIADIAKPVLLQECVNPYEKEYVEWSQSEGFYPKDNFYTFNYDKRIADLISAIVEFEGPISLVSLTRKVCGQFQISKATKKAQSRIADLAAKYSIVEESFKEDLTYWPKSLNISEYKEYRKNTPTASRKAEDIPAQEVAVAAYSIIKDNISLELPDLVRATANCFGFTRVGQNVQTSMENGIFYMLEKFDVQMEGERVSMG